LAGFKFWSKTNIYRNFRKLKTKNQTIKIPRQILAGDFLWAN